MAVNEIEGNHHGGIFAPVSTSISVNKTSTTVEISDDVLCELLANHLSIESIAIELGGRAPPYSEKLFGMWLERVGALPYNSKLNELVYEKHKNLNANRLLTVIGEGGVRFLLRASLYPPFDDTIEESLVESMEARIASVLDWDEEMELVFKAVGMLDSRGYIRRKFLTALWAHILNKAILSLKVQATEEEG